MLCKQCGAELEEGARFCEMCGSRLGEEKLTLSDNNLARSVSGGRASVLQKGLIAALLGVLALGGVLWWLSHSEKVDVLDLEKRVTQLEQAAKAQQKPTGISGVYVSEEGWRLEFAPDGNAFWSMGGSSTATTYRISGDRIIVNQTGFTGEQAVFVRRGSDLVTDAAVGRVHS